MSGPVKANDAMRQCLIELDARRARTIWHVIAPHLPRCDSDADMLTTLHVMRTAESHLTRWFPRHLRFYSHRWLLDQGLPSLLPDHLKPSAERMYPKKMRVLGYAPAGAAGEEACAMIGAAMFTKFAELEADGTTDKARAEPEIQRARFKERRALMLPKRYDQWDVPMSWRP